MVREELGDESIDVDVLVVIFVGDVEVVVEVHVVACEHFTAEVSWACVELEGPSALAYPLFFGPGLSRVTCFMLLY